MPLKTLNEEAIKKLMSYTWPGNIRELKSVIELAVVLANGDTIVAADINLGSSKDLLPDLISTKDLTLREYNKKIVEIFMKNCDNNTKAVADKLGIGQTTVYRLLKEE